MFSFIVSPALVKAMLFPPLMPEESELTAVSASVTAVWLKSGLSGGVRSASAVAELPGIRRGELDYPPDLALSRAAPGVSPLTSPADPDVAGDVAGDV
jgi:hypothetical protein